MIAGIDPVGDVDSNNVSVVVSLRYSVDVIDVSITFSLKVVFSVDVVIDVDSGTDWDDVVLSSFKCVVVVTDSSLV
ncbi:hypothetical protein DPMN_128441 [Dreissena polymorpha]|uniref:Uncharacterized protein n=1 Tax=Dreissena polymorpha TaxID=45954 RepID=A0A9D4JVR3_DREPO|nr:hypothetical protein DPMN_128441 [Dreissena polymorpha]